MILVRASIVRVCAAARAARTEVDGAEYVRACIRVRIRIRVNVNVSVRVRVRDSVRVRVSVAILTRIRSPANSKCAFPLAPAPLLLRPPRAAPPAGPARTSCARWAAAAAEERRTSRGKH